MYTAPQKKFSIKKESEVILDIEAAASRFPNTRRIFLADGDALVLSTRRLLAILDKIQKSFQHINRVSSYCLPRNVQSKTVDELKQLRSAGLRLVYVGAESGDDELLSLIDKGETFASTVDALQKLHNAEIKTSVMILNGLGGKQYSKQHAINSARLLSLTQPNYLATLVVSFPMGEERFMQGFPPDFTLLDQAGLFSEMELFIANTELKNTIFRSDHASNYLCLKGVLGRDKDKILEKIRFALQAPEHAGLRQDWQRGL